MPLENFEQTLAGKRVLLTGHTGFTGGWLAHWLTDLGCQVTGIGLAPETQPNLFEASAVADILDSHIVDIREADKVAAIMDAAAPDIVFHLAAQPLVRRSYRDPLETFSTNVMGTANVLEAARHVASVRAFVCITTDKVYDNLEWAWPYRETDTLGGKDPYSASKAAAELVTRAYQSTLTQLSNSMKIATVRGGNIVGGGDWSEDRIIPDFYRALVNDETLSIRNPGAVRPWQHVLSACHGYMMVAAQLLEQYAADTEATQNWSWNIGPTDNSTFSVRELIDHLATVWDQPNVDFNPSPLPEAQQLSLDVSKAKSVLGFNSPWDTEEVCRRVAEWYRDFAENPETAHALSRAQIADYRAAIPKV